MIRNSALEMGFSFLAATVCHLYIIIFHFVRTEAPRLSMCFTRLIIALLCTVMSSWILLYTFYIPQALFKAFFWWVIGPFLALNWFLSVPIGCTVNFLTCLLSIHSWYIIITSVVNIFRDVLPRSP